MHTEYFKPSGAFVQIPTFNSIPFLYFSFRLCASLWLVTDSLFV